MRKLTLALSFALTYSAVEALPLGNPGDASLYSGGVWWNDLDLEGSCWSWCNLLSIRSGFNRNYVCGRHLEKKDAGDLEKFSLKTNA